ncbi:hypothetical protein CYQ88_03465 [Hydrogenovibrio sp. SC-1]|uniref:hypothetical protein n=1 Tax=Hydrogenovibrio sp. SC-1 TaxID=2065820 RepID=UPI000C7B772A|nr:hypothetical protein [Hydrogenovibrio sp. SC-1]PLA74971.1 hypothetical protein CYQ88_03465 [Hydrogenovibrio sp. SC-1]
MKGFKKFDIVKIDGKEALIIGLVPNEIFSSTDGKLSFTPKTLYDHAEFTLKILGGKKHINFDLQAYSFGEKLYIISTNLKLKSEQIKSNIQSKLDSAKKNASLILENSGQESQKTVFLPGDLREDPERSGDPELIDGKLTVKNNIEVQTLLEIQTELKKRDVVIDGQTFEKIPKDGNLFLAKEDLRDMNQTVELKIEAIDFSKTRPIFKFSIVDKSILEKNKQLVKVKLVESLMDSQELLELISDLKFPPDERPTFTAECDLEKIYDENKGLVTIKAITLKKII